jgi:DNA-binding LacI/PurR family transcriptional regulator
LVQQHARRPRIGDVASGAGVSKSTVSIAFNNPERLSPETISRIRAVADALGYRPHPVARMLAQRHTSTLGILTPQALVVAFANPFFSMFSQGVASVAEEFGYGLLFISPLRGSLARAVARASVDGFVAIGLGEDHPEVEQIRSARLPIVLVDSAAFPEHGSVTVDDESGATAAANHLLDLGHRDFLILAIEPPRLGTDDTSLVPTALDSVSSRRLQGYQLALSARGVELSEARIAIGPPTFDGAAASLDRALDSGIHVTAVLAMSDVMAFGAIRAAENRGLRVPEDISVVGFDDIDEAEHSRPALTTVRQPVREKGAEAARLLLSAVDRLEFEQPEHRRLETRLITRASTAPVAATTGSRPKEVTKPNQHEQARTGSAN